MVTKRIRSEYMKKFKDPKWDTFSKCYEEMLKYRLARRLLEHSHNPWFWGGSDTDSDSGGRSPTPTGNGQTKENPSAEPEVDDCAEVKRNKTTESEPTVPGLVLSGDGDVIQGVDGEALERRCDADGEVKQLPAPQRKQAQGTHPKSQITSKQSQRVRPAPAQQIKEDGKQSRHPFVLYASGEKDSDIARRKTHNVRPVASTKEIHESALRAKTRRDVERQLHSQRAERRRAKSADVDKARLKMVAPEFNPWLTEYMRCFSARSR